MAQKPAQLRAICFCFCCHCPHTLQVSLSSECPPATCSDSLELLTTQFLAALDVCLSTRNFVSSFGLVTLSLEVLAENVW